MKIIFNIVIKKIVLNKVGNISIPNPDQIINYVL